MALKPRVSDRTPPSVRSKDAPGEPLTTAQMVADAVTEAAKRLPRTPQAEGEVAVAKAVIAAFLDALPVRFPMQREGGQTWGHSLNEMRRLAALVRGAP